MDDYAFEQAIKRCRAVSEDIQCLEMLSYSDSSLDSIKHQPLVPDEFDNFLHRRGIFAPAILPDTVHLTAGVRLILQENARHPETFAPERISMMPGHYTSMMAALHLPRIAIETSSATIFRKSDVRKKGKTRGWELLLCYDFSTRITTGFCKGTESSNVSKFIEQLKSCASEMSHAMLLPVIMFSLESSPAVDAKQRGARDWLKRLEKEISMGLDIEEGDSYTRFSNTAFDTMNRDLVECQAQVLWTRPKAYSSIIDSIEEAAQLFMQTLPESERSLAIESFHTRILSRLRLYKERWKGMEMYIDTTMQRLEIQRSALYNIMAQKESKLNFQIAADQKMLAHMSKRESEAMKGISLLGTIFLPGAFIGSIFSTTFFDFKDAPNMASVVSSRFWLYWAVTIPFTLVIVALYYLLEKRRLRSYAIEDADLQRDLDRMELDIISAMRNRTLSKTTTWNKGDEWKIL
ncbi:hypothetical protein B0I35DRAFT_471921 [Stachybotrys elegans]|uniref:Uncharacterized protein n=1 Tax=Stachybotrys elegans TaxID=80388 RepID=A0A8K0WKA8_9HYPO|nr:hypothetical protein B0I35DRAFT_471921 [Stachybotrys elegans]